MNNVPFVQLTVACCEGGEDGEGGEHGERRERATCRRPDLSLLFLAIAWVGCDASRDSPADSAMSDSGRADARIDDDAGESLDGSVDGGSTDTGVVVYGEMVLVPAGPFSMGCLRPAPEGYCHTPGYDGCCSPEFEPEHLVDVPSFFIDRTEVTVAAFADCAQKGVCVPRTGAACSFGKTGRENYPVDCVRPDEAEQFCLWGGKRMCTEAEWEKAARGGCELNAPDCRTRPYPWGRAQATCELAAIFGFLEGEAATIRECAFGPSPVGSFPAAASPYGVLDMVGNVHEPVEDCYHSGFVGAPTDGSAWLGDCDGPPRLWVSKGGSYEMLSVQGMSYFRTGGFVEEDSCCGIRCCQSL